MNYGFKISCVLLFTNKEITKFFTGMLKPILHRAHRKTRIVVDVSIYCNSIYLMTENKPVTKCAMLCILSIFNKRSSFISANVIFSHQNFSLVEVTYELFGIVHTCLLYTSDAADE